MAGTVYENFEGIKISNFRWVGEALSVNRCYWQYCYSGINSETVLSGRVRRLSGMLGGEYLRSLSAIRSNTVLCISEPGLIGRRRPKLK